MREGDRVREGRERRGEERDSVCVSEREGEREEREREQGRERKT